MKTKICILFFLVTCLAKAQQKKFSIQWEGQKNISIPPNSSILAPSFTAEHFNYSRKNKQLYFTAQWKTNNYVDNNHISSIATQPISKVLLKNIDRAKIPTKIEYALTTQWAQNVKYAVIRLNPLINDKGVIKKITSFVVSYTGKAYRAVGTKNNLFLPTSSIFANGNWYKFSIDKTGVYKITADFLQQLGINTSSINPKKLKIYGHGGAMLPLLNKNTKYYDPPQVSIKVIGGEDGSFDDDDYILFYGQGLHGKHNMQLDAYTTNINLYAEQVFYYLTIDGVNGKRIQTMAQPQRSSTQEITRFLDYQYYEKDEYSLVKVGRRWLGDRFNVETQKSFAFTFPNLDKTQPVFLQVYAASVGENTTSMMVSANGQQLSTIQFSGITDHAYASGSLYNGTFSAKQDKINVSLTYNNMGVPSSTGYLDFIRIEGYRKLIASNQQFSFWHMATSSTTGIGKFILQNTTNVTQVWEVTDPTHISSIKNKAKAGTLSFKASLKHTHEYITIVPTDFYTPTIKGNPRVANQDLKSSVANTEYLIITTRLLSAQAERLAQLRKNQKESINTQTVLLKDIYTEFSSGKPDIAAIRNFVYYTYHKYGKKLKYLCLFGDASVDYKNRLSGNNNVVPVYESYDSFYIGESSFPSDDFYGMLDASEGRMIGTGKLDLAVGRIIADSPQQAKIAVDKIIAYDSDKTLGSWRNNFVLISDDAEQGNNLAGYGLQKNLDDLGDSISTNKPFVNVYKIHSDAYQQQSSAGGFRYPEVNQAITEAIETGALVVNYLGHGGEEILAQERILTIPDIESWNNKGKYPVFLIITCEFTKFDNPLRPTGGEYLMWKKEAGAVALIGTTRTIGVSAGVNFNKTLAPFLFDYHQQDISIGEAVRLAKNETTGIAKRVIFYFGDPSMKLAIPKPKINLTSINNNLVSKDTLKALEKVSLSGSITTESGALLTDYNGVLSATIFDKPAERTTLNNDGVKPFTFTTLGEIIFKGKASVKNGEFAFNFIVPKDINTKVGQARVSFYATQKNTLDDRTGYNTAIKVGGVNTNAIKDDLGPKITLYMNDENFVSGGVTNSAPILLVKLSDSSGINTASGIGHDLVAIIDGEETNPYIVNDYYEAAVDDFTKGSVSFPFEDLKPGLHTLTFKAWDAYNNSSTAEIQFVVANDEDLKITHVLNYPNPFHTYTEFWFNHNHPFEPLKVQVQVFTISGKIVWSTTQTIITKGFLSRNIKWNGLDQFGQRIGKGVYVYKLTVKSTFTKDKVEKFEKLVIL